MTLSLRELSSLDFFLKRSAVPKPHSGNLYRIATPPAPRNIQRNVGDDVPLVGCAELQGMARDVGGEVPYQR